MECWRIRRRAAKLKTAGWRALARLEGVCVLLVCICMRGAGPWSGIRIWNGGCAGARVADAGELGEIWRFGEKEGADPSFLGAVKATWIVLA